MIQSIDNLVAALSAGQTSRYDWNKITGAAAYAPRPLVRHWPLERPASGQRLAGHGVELEKLRRSHR